MQRRSVLGFLLLSLLATSVQANPPWARDDEHRDKDNRHSSGRNSERQGEGEKRKNHDQFQDQDRFTVRDFYSRNPSSLPPGLAKRGGDLPPGLSRGQVLMPEHQVYLQPLPKDLEKLLPPPPHEVIRRIIGHDIVSISKVNNKVLDVLKDALP